MRLRSKSVPIKAEFRSDRVDARVYHIISASQEACSGLALAQRLA